MSHRPEDVRNLAFVGASGAGKTTLTEALLHKAGVIGRRGSVPEQNTVSDHDVDERERGHSSLATPVHLPWTGKRLHVVDAPGALDFIGEAILALAPVETAAICVSAADGVSVSTRRIFKAIRQQGLPACLVVTRCDADNIEKGELWESIRSTFGKEAVPLNLPDVYGPGVSAIHDVFGEDMPDALSDDAEAYRKQTVERVVEIDEELTMRYLEGETISPEELQAKFPEALRQGNIIPVLHVCAEKDVGLAKLLDFVVKDCPKPHRTVVRKAVDAKGEPTEVDPNGPFSAQVWKVQVDPHVGRVAYLRVWSGSIASKSEFTNARTGEAIRIGDLMEIQGKDMHAVPGAAVGDIVAVAKVEDVHVGDTVHDGSAPWVFVPIETPVPKVTLAVVPKNRSDEVKLVPELAKLAESDPTFVAEREDATHELVVRGMSSLHVESMLKRLARKKVEVETHTPRVPYMETIAGKGESQYRHKKQSGGRGQFAEVHLRVEPLPRGEDFEFVDEVVGGAIPRQFIPAVEKGIRETCAKGVFAGYPFTDVRATVYYGKFHDVDSDEFSFKLAAGQAFKAAVATAKPTLLEPIMEVTIEVPARFMGNISGDLNSRRGRLLGMSQEGDVAEIKAHVPLAEMQSYSTELRSMTAGEGDYAFHFHGYEPMPAHVAQEVIARHKKELEEAHA